MSKSIRISRVILSLLLLSLLTGCWEQHDEIKIKADGDCSFESEVVITENGIPQDAVDEISQAFMEDLQSAGWKVERKWRSKSRPYKLQFLGEGNIRQIKSAPDFYRIKKIDANTFSVRFPPQNLRAEKVLVALSLNMAFSVAPRLWTSPGAKLRASRMC